MIGQNTVMYGWEFLCLVQEIMDVERVDYSAASRLAASELPALLADEDTRYVPCRVVMFDRLSARELWDLTGGDNGR